MIEMQMSKKALIVDLSPYLFSYFTARVNHFNILLILYVIILHKGQSSYSKLYSILNVTVMVCDHIKAFSFIKEVCCSFPTTSNSTNHKCPLKLYLTEYWPYPPNIGNCIYLYNILEMESCSFSESITWQNPHILFNIHWNSYSRSHPTTTDCSRCQLLVFFKYILFKFWVHLICPTTFTSICASSTEPLALIFLP